MKTRKKLSHIILLIAMLALLFLSLKRFQVVITSHLRSSGDLKIESINLATVRSLQQGKAIYDAGFFGDLPFIITIYNPLYHFLTAILPQSQQNPVLTGRIVSLAASILILLLLLYPGWSLRAPKIWALPIITIAWVLLHPIFLENAVYMHPDMLAIFFSALAVVSLETPRSNKRIAAAALFAFLGFATKQSQLPATASCLLYLFFSDRRKAVLFASSWLLFFGGFLVFVLGFLGEGYWFSVFLSILDHPSFLSLTLGRLVELLRQPMFDMLLLAICVTVAYAFVRKKSIAIQSPYLLYVEFAAIIPLIALGKIGGEASYYLEFIIASMLWIVFIVRRFRNDLMPRYVIPFLIIFFSVAALEVISGKSSSYLLTEQPNARYLRYKGPGVVLAEIEGLAPRDNHFLFINTHVMLPFVREPYFSDPYNYFLMWNFGILDPKPMIRAIERKFFSVIVYTTAENPYAIPAMDPIPGGPGTNSVIKAIRENYRLSKDGDFRYLIPIEPLG
ncbi:MAG: hypothetical protein JRJ31_17335 [Deltaproteobacteria bacterium]|nr:hypothetical protein [Deltaproteobacteria bacterium]